MQVIKCVILTGELQVVAQPSGLSDSDEDALLAVSASSTSFVVWSARSWFVYSLSGLLLSSAHMNTVHAEILSMDVYDDDDDFGGQRLCVVWKSEQQAVCIGESHTLRRPLSQRDRHELCLQSSVVARSRQRQLVYSTDRHGDIICYTGADENATSRWRRRQGWSLDNQPDQLYSLTLSTDETLLIGQIVSGFKRWHLPTKRLVNLRLPSDVRNFPR